MKENQDKVSTIEMLHAVKENSSKAVEIKEGQKQEQQNNINQTSKPKTTKKPATKKATTKKVATKKTSAKKVASSKVENEQSLISEINDQNVDTQSVVNNVNTVSEKSTDNKKDQSKTFKAPRILEKKEKEEKEKHIKVRRGKKVPIEKLERYNVKVSQGLNDEQVEKRVAQKYTNVTENKTTKSYSQIFFGNIFTFFNMLCFTIAIALAYVKAPISNFIFMLTFMANLLIGIIQEVKAKKTVEKISLVVSPTATVIRNGLSVDIPVGEVVLDDIIFLNTGKQICADSVVVEGEVEVNESLLTGESVAIKKKKGDFLLSGSFIVGGKCSARVDKVGEDCYTSKLAIKAKKYNKPKSELLGSLNLVIKIIGVIIIPLATLTFLNIYHGDNGSIQKAILYTAGSAIGMIPAGMFLLTSMALAFGVIKLANQRTLVQDLYSIEMLARTNVLCLDKTGTITDGTMKVHSVVQLNSTNGYSVTDIVGSMLTALDDNNQTSRALASHFGYSKELTPKTLLPFNSARKLSAVTFKNNVTYCYGAPEFVMKSKNAELDKYVKEYAQKGFRVLLLARAEGQIKDDTIGEKKTPICLIIIEDHIREDAPKTIEWFKNNGVEIKIISGDNPVTVSEVSRRVGVDRADRYISLEGLSEQQVIDCVDDYTVFGRVSPEQKSILVRALKSKGKKVAMTGDGVNDILAMKEADCSIAMASGSEATRNVSHLVLLDNNFASMPSVVSEGRRVVNNIQNTSSLYLMKTIFTILITIFYLSIKKDYPFSTSHMILLEFFVIGIPSFFLALQPNSAMIKGRFLSNLMMKALPSALIFTLNVIACYYFNEFVFTSLNYVTTAAITVAFSGIMVLFTLCKPLNVYRGILFFSNFIIFTLTLVFGFYFLGFTELELTNILFIIILVQLSYPFYNNFQQMFNNLLNKKTEQKVNKFEVFEN